ncbi:DNA-binding CsgD family transcriptional regulator [Haloferula luteola]|uniref:DNA-binding CsgD family transcriptional regulator n=1 Tax=Haloferula luteola TaxID=595692 RepID=A0A840V1Y2_9BACT|nr:helix-turn-helix transcriptional regulator [Haloferula luteola]MBB5352337.1 DNA-binding CsgD family transcriptional regulator [Haloferula luteola]
MSHLIHDRFLQLALELQSAPEFRMVAEVLCHRLPDQISGGTEGWLITVTANGERISVGHGREGDSWGTGALSDRGYSQDFADLVTQLRPQDKTRLGLRVSEQPELAEACATGFETGREFSDMLVGHLMTNGRNHCLLAIPRETGRFDDEALRAFDYFLLLSRAVLDRLAADNLGRQFRKIYLGSPPSAHAAVFVLHANGDVLPVNFEGIRFAETSWGDDQAFGRIDPFQMKQLRTSLQAAWVDPATAEFHPIDITFAGGQPVAFVGLPRPDGEILLVHFPKDASVCGDEALSAVLTRRQKEIMGWIAEGKTSAEVAIILNISPRTVEKHLEAVFQRLGVENRIAAVRRYLDLKAGILD